MFRTVNQLKSNTKQFHMIGALEKCSSGHRPRTKLYPHCIEHIAKSNQLIIKHLNRSFDECKYSTDKGNTQKMKPNSQKINTNTEQIETNISR